MDESRIKHFRTEAKPNLGWLTSSVNDFSLNSFEYVNAEEIKKISFSRMRKIFFYKKVNFGAEGGT